MLIGFDGSRAFEKERTGTENYSYYLLKALSQIDLQNSYLIYIKKSQESRVKSLQFPSNYHFKTINLPRLWTQVGLALVTFTDKLDILFIPSHTLPLIRKPGLKTVLAVHDLGAEFLPSLHQLKQVLYLKLMTYLQLKSATRLIAVSESTKKDIIKKVKIDSSKIKVIYEGYNKDIVNSKSNTKKDILSKFDIQSNKYFLHVGTIQPRKNLSKIIEAFSVLIKDIKGINDIEGVKGDKSLDSLKDFKLVIAGGKGWKSESIYSLPKKLGIAPQVIFLGRVEDSLLPVLYMNAKALVFASLFEGFGLPILEAFAFGCPVITSNNSSLPEVAGKAAILVNPRQTKEIVEAMVEMITNDTLREKLIIMGYNRLKHFSWEKAARETLELFKEVKSSKLSAKAENLGCKSEDECFK